MQNFENCTVSEIASTYPNSYRVFHKYGIDFCCGGKKKLLEVCTEKSIDTEDLAREIFSLSASEEGERDWQKESIADLVEHIIDTHHEYLRQELPRIHTLFTKVVKRHGEDHPFLLDAFETFCSMSEELRVHIHKEEEMLFPAIIRADHEYKNGASLSMPIQVMEGEHVDTGRDLETLYRLTSGYKIDDSYMCASFKALYNGLSDLDQDTKLHIHKENNILFPRVLALKAA